MLFHIRKLSDVPYTPNHIINILSKLSQNLFCTHRAVYVPQRVPSPVYPKQQVSRQSYEREISEQMHSFGDFAGGIWKKSPSILNCTNQWQSHDTTHIQSYHLSACDVDLWPLNGLLGFIFKGQPSCHFRSYYLCFFRLKHGTDRRCNQSIMSCSHIHTH